MCSFSFSCPPCEGAPFPAAPVIHTNPQGSLLAWCAMHAYTNYGSTEKTMDKNGSYGMLWMLEFELL